MTGKALQRHQERLQRALRTITGQRIEIVSAASCGLTVSPDVAMFASGTTIVVCKPIDDVVRINSLMTHEAAHIVVSGSQTPMDLKSVASVVPTKWRDWPAHAGKLKFHGHEFPFIRASLHIAHRLAGMGFPSLPEWVFVHQAYGLSSGTRYLKALDDEPKRLSWVPLCEVLNRQSPESFRKLWADDVVRSVRRSLLKKGE